MLDWQKSQTGEKGYSKTDVRRTPAKLMRVILMQCCCKVAWMVPWHRSTGLFFGSMGECNVVIFTLCLFFSQVKGYGWSLSGTVLR